MTGKELWSASPGFDVGGAAVVYRGANGKQYVVDHRSARDRLRAAVVGEGNLGIGKFGDREIWRF